MQDAEPERISQNDAARYRERGHWGRQSAEDRR